MTTLDAQDLERFWAKVDQRGDGECWIWLGTKSHNYGVLKVNGQNVRAHRLALSIAGVTVEASDLVLHSCDVPACVNPFHLRVGTHADNMSDMVSRGRSVNGDGARNNNAKLLEGEVRLIHARLLSGEKHTSIAADFCVSEPTIHKIAAGKRWQHLGLPVVRRYRWRVEVNQ